MRRAVPMFVTACLFATSACSEDPSAATEPWPGLAEGEFRHADLLTRTDADVEFHRERAQAAPDSWAPLQRLSGSLLSRGRLTGELADLVAASEAAQQGFERAPEGAGPWYARAQADFALHRFDRAGEALDGLERRILLDDPTRAAIEGLRGDLALQAGDVAGARAHLEASEALDSTPTSASRRAHLAWRTGDYATAESLYRDGLARYRGTDASVPAWFHLQLGILDLERDDLDAAMEHFLAANGALSGYYLIEEHVAEVLTLQGRTDDALPLYLDIVERTQNPEFMDAVAGIYLERGDEESAQRWIDRARAGYEAQMELAPKAAWGHAIGHYLDFGPASRAVELAEQNHAIRPNAAAKAELAETYLAADRVADAERLAEQLATSEWRTADTLAVAYDAFVTAGRGDEAMVAALGEELCGMAPRRCPAR